MSWAKRQRTGSATRKLVLLTIADYANDDGVAWPSQRTIAIEAELNERSIRRALEQMETAGLLWREKRPPLPSGQMQSDKIHLNLHATGQRVRAFSPADSHDIPADTESGKPPRNYLIQGREQTYQGKALGKEGCSKRRPAPAMAHGSWVPDAEDEL
jgi:hypothetical protein